MATQLPRPWILGRRHDKTTSNHRPVEKSSSWTSWMKSWCALQAYSVLLKVSTGASGTTFEICRRIFGIRVANTSFRFLIGAAAFHLGTRHSSIILTHPISLRIFRISRTRPPKDETRTTFYFFFNFFVNFRTTTVFSALYCVIYVDWSRAEHCHEQ